MSHAPFVSVIIPTYHDWERLRICLDALTVQSYPANRFEILVVNNDPGDVPPYCIAGDNVQLLREAKPGSYAARNAAIEVANGDVLAFTDSDCIPDVHWLRNAVRHLVDGAERIAGHVELFFRSDKLSPMELYERAFAFDQEYNAARGTSVTANMITWRKSFCDVGLFNDQLMSGGDVEWGWRARAAGIPISYLRSAIVRHPARYALAGVLRKRRRVIGGAEMMKHASGRHSVLRLLTLGYLPPVRAFWKLVQTRGMTSKEKLLVLGVSWFLRCYGTSYHLGLKLRLYPPERL